MCRSSRRASRSGLSQEMGSRKQGTSPRQEGLGRVQVEVTLAMGSMVIRKKRMMLRHSSRMLGMREHRVNSRIRVVTPV